MVADNKKVPLRRNDELGAIQAKYAIPDSLVDKYLIEDVTQQHVADVLMALCRERGIHVGAGLVVGAGRGGLSSILGLSGVVVDSLKPYALYSEVTAWKYAQYGLQGRVMRSTVEDASLPSAHYDFAAMIDVIKHIESPVAALGKIRAALKDGGALYLTVPNRLQLVDPHYKLPFICWMPMKISDHLLKLLGRLHEDGPAGRQRLSSMHYYTYWGFRALAAKNGYAVVDVRKLQIERPEAFVFQGDRFACIIRLFRNAGLGWLLVLFSRAFLGHRLLLVKI